MSKKSRIIVDTNNESGKKSKNVVLYFVPERIQQKRLRIMKECASRNGFAVVEDPAKSGTDVTHLITDFENQEQVLRCPSLVAKERAPGDSTWCIVSTKWFTDSVKAGYPLPASDEYVVKKSESGKGSNDSGGGARSNFEDVNDYSCYACERKTLLLHRNHNLTDALSLMAEYAELRADSGKCDYSRALAFRKATAAIKSLPFTVTKASQIGNLKDIGQHCRSTIHEVLEDGSSNEVERIKSDTWFNVVKSFNAVFGVGQVKASKWFEQGFRTVADIKQKVSSGCLKIADERILHGLAFHRDLTTPVKLSDAEGVVSLVREHAEKILPGVRLELIGGFRRGKLSGHDVDILISHSKKGKEIGLLSELHDRLTALKVLVYGRIQNSSYTEDSLHRENRPTHNKNSNMDLFEKCFCIFRLFKPENRKIMESDGRSPGYDQACNFQSLDELASSARSWKAVRVDLIVCPADQFAYALVGWTGNKHFNRSLRDYAKRKLNMKLTSHGLWDYNKQKSIPAGSEQEVFANLNLKYLEPFERNA